MSAVIYLLNWIDWIFILVPIAAGTMISYQAFRKSISDDPNTIGECNKRIGYIIYGSIIALTILGFISVVKSFYA